MLLLFFGGPGSPSPGSVFTITDHPVIGWQNLVTISNITASSADADYPVSNLANPATNLRWQANDLTQQTITITTGTSEEIDYIGVAKHNFASAGISVSVEGDDGGGFAALGDPVIPDDDGPLILRFEPAVYNAVRIVLSAPDTSPEVPARMSVVYCGKLLELPRKIYQGHTPILDGRKSKVIDGVAESGDFIGSIVLGRWTETNIALSLIEPAFFRSNMRAFCQQCKHVPFFFGWRPLTYPLEVGYARTINDPKPVNAAPSGLVSLDLNVRGVI